MSGNVFPSDLTAVQRADPAREPQVNYAPVQAGAVAAFRQRYNDGHFVFNGAALPYPASLPTSGINATIVEFHRGSAVVRDEMPAPTQSRLSGYVAPPIGTLSPMAEPVSAAPASASSSPRKKAGHATVAPIRQLVVPVLSDSGTLTPTPYEKPIVERVAFDFSQPPILAPIDDDVVKEVLLDDMEAFEEWMGVQVTLQNWLVEESVDMAKQAQKAREREAAARLADGRDKPRAYNRKKPTMKTRIVYLCSHAKVPEPSRAKEPPEKSSGKKRKRRVKKASIKVGCKAKMLVSELADGTIRVRVDGHHTNHDPRSAQSMTDSRMPMGVKEWIDARVVEGMDAQVIYNHVAVSEATIEKYESSSSDEATASEDVPGVDHLQEAGQLPMLYNFRVNLDDIRARIRHNNSLRRRFVGPNGEALAEAEGCGALLNEIRANGGWSFTHIGQSPDGPYDVVAFATKWQIKMLRKYGGTVMMDATHNVAKGLSRNKAYPYTLIVKNKKVNRGTPVAFMITASASQYPVEIFLQKLFSEDTAPSCNHKPHTLMIDCSRTEAAAISRALGGTKVLYCHYHFWNAVNANLDKKVGKGTGTTAAQLVIGERRNAAKGLIQRMVKSKTEDDFDVAWNAAQHAWSTQGEKWQNFLAYFIRQWHYQVDEWAGYSRKYEHGGIDTNNYLESWHQKLKRNYIRKRNLNMPDVIAMLTREILPLYRLANVRVSKGFANVSLTTAERKNRERAMEYDETDMMHCVEILDAEFKEIRVRSLQDPSIYYTITYGDKGDAIQPLTCSCPSYQGSHDRCKHLFLVERCLEAVPKVVAEDPPELDMALDDAVDVDDTVHVMVEDLRTDGGSTRPADDRRTAPPTVGLSSNTFPVWSMDLDPQLGLGVEDVQGEEDEDILEDDSRPPLTTSNLASTSRLMSSSPPPSYVLERERRSRQEGEAIRETWNELTETLYTMSISTELAERYDQERMTNMVAQLQTMISTWQEAIGQKEPGAAQRR